MHFITTLLALVATLTSSLASPIDNTATNLLNPLTPAISARQS